jgi:hypothetical protein
MMILLKKNWKSRREEGKKKIWILMKMVKKMKIFNKIQNKKNR